MNKQLTMTTAMAAALLALPACSSNNNEWNEDVVADKDTAVCVDQQGKRVEDNRCGAQTARAGGGIGAAPFLWYYLGRSSAIPYYGDSINDRRFAGRGSFEPRQGVAYARAPASTGMTRSRAVSRGGLGSSGRYFGGGRS